MADIDRSRWAPVLISFLSDSNIFQQYMILMNTHRKLRSYIVNNPTSVKTDVTTDDPTSANMASGSAFSPRPYVHEYDILGSREYTATFQSLGDYEALLSLFDGAWMSEFLKLICQLDLEGRFTALYARVTIDLKGVSGVGISSTEDREQLLYIFNGDTLTFERHDGRIDGFGIVSRIELVGHPHRDKPEGKITPKPSRTKQTGKPRRIAP